MPAKIEETYASSKDALDMLLSHPMNDNNISDTLYEKRCALEEHVMRFSENEKQYKAPSYDEANTRVDFIDKFFTLLGWDVSNDEGYAEQYRGTIQ